MTNTIAAEEFQSYIGGRTAGDGAVIAWDSPALSGAATSFASASVAQVDQAVRLAHGAQMQWADMPPLVRQHFLYEFAKKIEGDAETLGRMDCTDMGKPISVAIQEAHVTAFILRYYAGAIDKVAGQVIPSVREALTVSYPRPYGVVGAMISWNYPAINAAMKFAPALAAGNAIVLKPSDQAPRSAIRLAALAEEAGLPRGLYVALAGGAETGRALCSHAGVDMLAFTGSTRVGREVAQMAAAQVIPAIIEAGGKNPILVCDDITDIEGMARDVIAEAFANSGQLCSARSKIVVPKAMVGRIGEALAAAAAATLPGAALEAATTHGPLSSLTHANRITNAVDRAMQAGGQVLRDGRGKDPLLQGISLIAAGAEAEIFREEYFGPVLAMGTYDWIEDGVALANAGGYGLAATIWTGDIGRANALSRQVVAGHIKVKSQPGIDVGTGMALPIEPAGKSGYGTEWGVAALQSYTRRQAVEFQGFRL